MASASSGLVVLSRDHGNIAGHSPIHILKEIMGRLNYDIESKNICVKWRETNKRPVRPHDVFHIIAGSGTGGLIARMLSSLQLDVLQATEEYLRVASLLFPGASSAETEPASATTKLEELLKKLIATHHSSLSQSAPLIGTPEGSSDGLILAHYSTNIRSIPALFRTYESRKPKDNIACELWQVFRATTADLGMGTFAEVFINGKRYSGTSFKNGNPTQELTTELRQRFPDHQVALLLSLGSGYPQTISLPPGTSKDVEETLKALNKDCEETHQKMSRSWHQLSRSGPYHRLNVAQGMQDMENKSYSADIIGEVVAHSEQYMSEHKVDQEIDRIVEILVNRMVEIDLDLSFSGSPSPINAVPAPVTTSSLTSTGRKKLLALDGAAFLAFQKCCF
ncbi:hypothetical protein DL96DRAFT_1192710 [Flagelloscypha sp. PMI_526]|nr:hypothetical protein DL96DRAFT_1192710 [Flagelloscypha sp. PMI_526]